MGSIKTAIVGYGLAGKVFHAQLIRAVEGLELYAVATRDPQRRADAAGLGVVTYETIEQVLSDDAVQLVVIATPHETHADLCIGCLDAGRHVVTDKIMCLNTAEADAMIGAAKRNHRMLSVFHNRRWDGDFLTVRKAMADGLIGEPLIIESSVVSFRKVAPTRWRSFRKHGGGMFHDWGAHLTDQALQLIDAPVVSVYADMLYTEPSVDIETSGRCLFTFDNGVRYVVETGSISHLARPRWYVRGTEGALLCHGLDPQEDALKRGVVDSTLPQPPEHCVKLVRQTPDSLDERVLAPISGDWSAFYRNIADHLLEGAPLAVTPESVRRSIALIQAAVESAGNRGVVNTRI